MPEGTTTVDVCGLTGVLGVAKTSVKSERLCWESWATFENRNANAPA
jgi:hypothetical protein